MANEIPVLDTNALVSLKKVKPENALTEVDKDVFTSIDFFHENKFNEAIELVMKSAGRDSTHALAAGFMSLLQAFSSMEMKDIESATDVFQLAVDVADAQNSEKTGYLRSFSNMVVTTEELNWINLRCSSIGGTCNVLRSFLYLMQASVSNVLKSGICVMKGIHTIESDFGKYEKIPADKIKDTIDENTEANLLMMIGAINIVTGLLPPVILKIISVFGYKSNLKLGYDCVRRCESKNSIYSSLVPLLVLAVHSIHLSFAPGLQLKEEQDEMKSRLRGVLKKHPNALLYLIIYNRFKRADRKLQQSTTILNKAVDCQDQWLGFKFLAQYEMFMSQLFMGDYKATGINAKDLTEKDRWAQPFLSYCAAASNDMINESTIESYEKSRNMTNRKFGGRVIATEQFVTKRIEYFNTLEAIGAYSADDIRRLHLPGLEVAFLFNGFACKNKEEIESSLKLVEDAIKVADTLDIVTLNNHLSLLKFALLRNLNIINKTYDLSLLELVETIDNDIMNWIQPMAMFEMAHLHLDAYLLTQNIVYLDQAQSMFKKTMKFSGYIFEYRLHFRIQQITEHIAKY